ncbi:MAG TPA: hypothetical protein VLY03_07005 [Bacteroidota bacterium]|nr:hypothetical protein [Bacteroidota bacterium]
MITKAFARRVSILLIAAASLLARGYSVAQPKPESFRMQKSSYLYYRHYRHHRRHYFRHYHPRFHRRLRRLRRF